jgi:hypothetical protein
MSASRQWILGSTGKMKTVDPEGELVRTARAMAFSETNSPGVDDYGFSLVTNGWNHTGSDCYFGLDPAENPDPAFGTQYRFRTGLGVAVDCL